MRFKILTITILVVIMITSADPIKNQILDLQKQIKRLQSTTQPILGANVEVRDSGIAIGDGSNNRIDIDGSTGRIKISEAGYDADTADLINLVLDSNNKTFIIEEVLTTSITTAYSAGPGDYYGGDNIYYTDTTKTEPPIIMGFVKNVGGSNTTSPIPYTYYSTAPISGGYLVSGYIRLTAFEDYVNVGVTRTTGPSTHDITLFVIARSSYN